MQMASNESAKPKGKKRKIADEKRVFHEPWTNEYFVIEHKGMVLCLICNETIAAQKEYNIKRHYTTKYGNFAEITGQVRIKKVARLQQNIVAQQSLFKKADNEVKSLTRLSYVITEQLAKKMPPFSNGEFVKTCIGLFVDEICPERRTIVNNMCLSRTAVARRVTEMSADIESTLKEKVATFQSYPIKLLWTRIQTSKTWHNWRYLCAVSTAR